MSVFDSIDRAREQLGRKIRGEVMDPVANRVQEVKSIINKHPQLCRNEISITLCHCIMPHFMKLLFK